MAGAEPKVRVAEVKHTKVDADTLCAPAAVAVGDNEAHFSGCRTCQGCQNPPITDLARSMSAEQECVAQPRHTKVNADTLRVRVTRVRVTVTYPTS